MKLSLFFALLLPLVSAFSTSEMMKARSTTTTHLDAIISRRHALEFVAAAAAVLVAPTQAANAFSQQLDDFAYEPQQQATDGKLDLNAAFVGEYKVLRGMFPTAGKLKQVYIQYYYACVRTRTLYSSFCFCTSHFTCSRKDCQPWSLQKGKIHFFINQS